MSYAINVANNNFGSNFRGILFDVSKEWVRSWSHAFLITNLKTFSKKLLAVCPEKGTRRKKRNKTRMAIVNLVALKANAKTYINLFQNHYIPIISKPSRTSFKNFCNKLKNNPSQKYKQFFENWCKNRNNKILYIGLFSTISNF